MLTLTLCMIRSDRRQSDISKIKKYIAKDYKLKDVTSVALLPNIEILNFNCNFIKNLRALRHCHKLKELHLLQNRIGDIKELNSLRDLPLEILTVAKNPFTFHVKDYRLKVIKMFPRLKILDDEDITDEERERANSVVTQNMGTGKKEFRGNKLIKFTESTENSAEPIPDRKKPESLNSATTEFIYSTHELSPDVTPESVYTFRSVMGCIGEMTQRQLEIVMDEVARELEERTNQDN